MRADVIFDVPLPPSEALRTIAASIDQEIINPLSLSHYSGHRPFLGEVKGNKFRIQRRNKVRRALRPQLYGQVLPHDSGSQIVGYFDAPLMGKVQGVSLFVLLLGVPVALVLWELIQGNFNPNILSYLGLAIPGILGLLFGWLITRSKGPDGDRAALESHIRNVFAAPISRHQAN